MLKMKALECGISLLCFSMSLAVISGSALPKQASKRPHIILIVADDLGYNDVSFHGSDQIPTPNIDFLGYNGIILNNYYVSPICTPTRSALMTGRHPIHTGMNHGVIVGSQEYGLPLNETIMPQYFKKLGMQHSVLFGADPYGLPLNETLLSEYLNTLGYRSRIVGKWHLGMFKWEYTPLYRGFESHLGYYQGCEDYYTHTYEANLQQWGMDFRRDKELAWNYTSIYSTDIFRDEAVRVINEHDKSEPLFLYLPFQAVHSGNGDEVHLQAPENYVNKFSYIENKDRRTYAAMVSALDDAVGEVYDTLKKNDMLNNSIIVFTTDNGGPANGFDFNAANNYPLRGVKATLWEGGVRGVGLVHSPLLRQQGYVSNQMLHVCDWVPTLYSAAGGDASALKNLDGYDSWAMLNDNGKPIRTEMLHNIDPIDDNAAIRVGDYKLLVGNINMQWDGWYPPYQLDGDEYLLHYTNYSGHMNEKEYKVSLREKLQSQYQNYWPSDIKSRISELKTFSEQSQLYGSQTADVKLSRNWQQERIAAHRDRDEFTLTFRSETEQLTELRHGGLRGTPVTLKCGEKPANASTNCNTQVAPCLYHIPTDPCEYNNIAQDNPDIVVQLQNRLKTYVNSMVPPGNKPYDDRGNPKYHQGAWVPWQ